MERQQAQTHPVQEPVQEPFLKRGRGPAPEKQREEKKTKRHNRIRSSAVRTPFLGWDCVGELLCVSGGGAEQGGGAMEAQRSLIHAHLLSLCPSATPEPASNSMWRQSQEIIRTPWFDKWGELYQRGGVRVPGLVSDTHSVGEDVVYRSLFSRRTRENFFALCLKRDMM